MDAIFEVNYAGIPLRYQFLKKQTAPYFGRNIRLTKVDAYDIKMNEKEFQFFRDIHPEGITDAYVEYKGLIYLTSEKLLTEKCCIFHAVSFYWKNKAWLITGKSGIGKTTQYMNWTHLYPNEITMISGDMPLLDFREDKICVHPSPWNGKEGIKSTISAELGGIVILNQADYNTIEQAEMFDSIPILYHQFPIIPRKEKDIHLIAGMVQRTIEEIPIWILSNDGSEDSTRMLRETLLKQLEEKRI